MKITRWVARLATLMLVASCGLAPIARAQTEVGAEPPPTDGTDRWWGVAGAALCGGELWLIRTNPVVGMNPYALAAGIGGCLLAALDVTT
jgi:hypothetical protein